MSDGDDGVLHVQGQEAGHGGDEEVADEDDCVGDGGQHTQQGDFLGVGDVCTHNGSLLDEKITPENRVVFQVLNIISACEKG